MIEFMERMLWISLLLYFFILGRVYQFLIILKRLDKIGNINLNFKV